MPSTPNASPEINELVLRPLCADFQACHSVRGGAGPSGLDLITDPYRALVGVRAVQPQATREGRLRVKPCDPDGSFLWVKLDLFNPRYINDQYGGPMPLDRPPVPALQREAIRAWIARGAPEIELPDGGESGCFPDACLPDGPMREGG